MFDALSDRFETIFRRLRGRGRLGEAEVDEVLREIRLALLEADVNFKVVKGLIARIRDDCIGADLLGRVEGLVQLHTDAPLADTGDEVTNHLEVHVRLEQGEADLAQDLVDLGLAHPAAASHALEDRLETIGEIVEHD